MKSKLVIPLVILVGLFTGIRPLAAQAPSLAGSWQLTLTPESSTEQVIHALATFTTDGSVIEADSSEIGVISPSVRSGIRPGTPGHGIWQPAPVQGNLYIQFISLIVNPIGTLYGRKTVTLYGAMDGTGNNFTGTYSYTVVDPNGVPLGSGSGTVTGQRIPHPALP